MAVFFYWWEITHLARDLQVVTKFLCKKGHLYLLKNKMELHRYEKPSNILLPVPNKQTQPNIPGTKLIVPQKD